MVTAMVFHSPVTASLNQTSLRPVLKSLYKSNFHLNPKRCDLSSLRVTDGCRLKCNSSLTPGGSDSGDNESRSVLDAFFLGKAVAEAINERVESTVGEILSTIGRLQAEQQKQVQEFQDEVLERAKRAKEKAAREAKASQGLPVKSTTTTTNTSVAYTTSSTSASSSTSTVTPNDKDDSVIGVPNDL